MPTGTPRRRPLIITLIFPSRFPILQESEIVVNRSYQGKKKVPTSEKSDISPSTGTARTKKK